MNADKSSDGLGHYTSFLICFHSNHADIYLDGLPLGIMLGKHFIPHKHKLADGTEKPVKAIDGEIVVEIQRVVNAMSSEVSPE